MAKKVEEHTLQTKADEMRGYLETRKRDDGEDFICIADGAPDWVTGVCHKAHGDMMPDDWRYRMISDALDILADCDNEDRYDDSLDSDVSIYNADRTAWLASNLTRAYYVDDAISEYGWSKEGGLFTALGIGELMERHEVLNLVKSALEELL